MPWKAKSESSGGSRYPRVSTFNSSISNSFPWAGQKKEFFFKWKEKPLCLQKLPMPYLFSLISTAITEMHVILILQKLTLISLSR